MYFKNSVKLVPENAPEAISESKMQNIPGSMPQIPLQVALPPPPLETF